MSLVNQMCVLPFVQIGTPYCINDNHPGILVCLGQLIFYALIADQWFYWTHRLMHHSWFYRRIHCVHHEWTYPITYSTLYAHPVEHIVVNIGSFLIGPLLSPNNIWMFGIWVAAATLNAVLAHSGLRLKYTSIEKHDLHHQWLNCNFGTSGISDRMYGTRKFKVN